MGLVGLELGAYSSAPAPPGNLGVSPAHGRAVHARQSAGKAGREGYSAPVGGVSFCNMRD